MKTRPAELASLTKALHDRIAMTRFLQVRITAFEAGRIELAAPLGPTLNHRGVAFGPGVFTTAALAPWLLLVRWMWARRVPARIVLRRSEFALHRPIDRDFRAACDDLPPIAIDDLIDNGRIRLSATSLVHFDDGEPAATYVGHFTIVHAPGEAPVGDLALPFPAGWQR